MNSPVPLDRVSSHLNPGVRAAPCGCAAHLGQSQTAGMEMQACWIEINGNKMLPGSLVKPAQKLTFVADMGFLFGDKVRFSLRDDISGALWIGPTEVSSYRNLTGGWAQLEVTLPFTEAAVTLIATEIRPLMPDSTRTFPFIISLKAPDPPGPKKSLLEQLTPWLIAGGVLLALVALSPSINRAVGAVTGQRRGAGG